MYSSENSSVYSEKSSKKQVHFVRKKGSCSVQKKSLAKKFTSFRKKFQEKVHFAQKKSSGEFRQKVHLV